MSGRSKRYSKQFKKDAVTYVREHDDLSVNAAAKNLGVAASTLGKWVEKADGGKKFTADRGIIALMRLKKMQDYARN